MNKTQKYLLGALALQIILIVVIFFLQRPVAASNNLVFTDLKIEAVTGINLSDSTGKLLTLQKEGDHWILPDQANYPVNSDKVNQLIDSLAAIRDNRLVTRSESSQERLQISNNNFAHKVELTVNGKKEIIYFGSSPTSNNFHFRLGGKNEVYLTNAVTTNLISTTISDWVDTIIYQIPYGSIKKISVKNGSGIFQFQKDATDQWTSEQLPTGSQFDQSKWSSLLTAFSTMRMVEPISKTVLPEYGFTTPSATIQIDYSDDAGTALSGTFIIGTKDESGNYYAQWSHSDYIYKISSYNAERITNLDMTAYSSEIPTPTPEAN